MPTWEAKGKARALPQEEGSGGTGGIVLPLQVAGGGVYDIAYTIDVSVGSGGQKLSLQVDTGSSDLWITSKSCTSSICGQTNGHTYDPSGSKSTGVAFDITYLQGKVSGPIVWDQLVIGGYSIENQALAAADQVASEPLSSQFTGILGLALPLNSIIATRIPPVTDNAPDGAAWASNLFSITPVSSAPAARFLSLLLSRPGSNAVPSQLGIGRHPSFITNSSKVRYSTLVSERTGTLFWKVGVRAITVWANGTEMPVEIGRSNSGAVFPSAVLDSGVPLIFTTRQVANGIYGAIGISPGGDGQYYVPCTTPLNLTITIDDRPPLPLHPLDLTAEPPKDNQAAFCIGIIQAADSVLAQPNSPVGDMILGVPFLRNVYSVMAYTPPDDQGGFPTTPSAAIRPSLGLLGLTDPVVALDEFRKVRVLNQPISPGGSGAGPTSQQAGASGGKKISVGIAVLIGLLGFFALCVALFGVRWWVVRRRYRRAPVAAASAGVGGVLALGRGGPAGEKEGGYALAARGSRDMTKTRTRSEGGGPPSEDVLRTLRYEAYMQDHGLVDLGLGKKGSRGTEDEEELEMGYRRPRVEDPWDPTTALGRGRERDAGWGDETLVQRGGVGVPFVVASHGRTASSGVPLLHEMNLEHDHEHERLDPEHERSEGPRGVDEFGVQDVEVEEEERAGMRTSMAGVGTAARGGTRVWAPEGLAVGRAGQESSGGTSGAESDVVFRRMSGAGR